MSSDLRQYWNTRARSRLISFGTGIGIVAGVISFAPLPYFVLIPVWFLGAAAALRLVFYLIYELGKFIQEHQVTQATIAISDCCRYLRYGHQIPYDAALVNQLARAIWLRKHHAQWSVVRVDADNQHLFLGDGSQYVLEGLIFSIVRLGDSASCQYALQAVDMGHKEIRLQPSGFQIRAADAPECFSIDLIDPSTQEEGNQVRIERLLAGALGALDAR